MKKMFKDRCYKGGNKHKFEAVYAEKREYIFGCAGKTVVSTKYEGHICKWCGKLDDEEGFEFAKKLMEKGHTEKSVGLTVEQACDNYKKNKEFFKKRSELLIK